MDIIVDSREQLPYTFDRHRKEGDTVQTGGLKTGDYSIKGYEGKVAVERKSLGDFMGSISSGRSRFENEMLRAAEMDYFAIVIEGSPTDISRGKGHQSGMNPHAALQTAISWSIRHNVHIFFADSRDGGEYFTYWILQKFLRHDEMSGNGIANGVSAAG